MFSAYKFLNTDGVFQFIHKKELTSTSTLARQLAENNAAQGVTVVADRQTGGRGRKGRSFFSPDATGLYFSVILRPDLSREDALFITTSAAVSICEAIVEIAGKSCGIKWVNDIYINNKKICGILTEAGLDSTGNLKYVILGIGINLFPPKEGFPDEINSVAGTLFEKGEADDDIKYRLLAKILDNFYSYYKNLNSRTFVPKYQKLSIMSGKKIIVHGINDNFEATAQKIDDLCRLIIKTPDGQKKTLSSGEISIKFI